MHGNFMDMQHSLLARWGCNSRLRLECCLADGVDPMCMHLKGHTKHLNTKSYVGDTAHLQRPSACAVGCPWPARSGTAPHQRSCLPSINMSRGASKCAYVPITCSSAFSCVQQLPLPQV